MVSRKPISQLILECVVNVNTDLLDIIDPSGERKKSPQVRGDLSCFEDRQGVGNTKINRTLGLSHFNQSA